MMENTPSKAKAKAKKLPSNVPGKYYTTEDCDGCAYCAAVAPDNFEFEKASNTYFVGRQPETTEQEEFVGEAKDDCPVDAIQADEAGNPVPPRSDRPESSVEQ